MSATGPDGRPACYRQGDGEEHDEAFRCHACEKPVCGYCAKVVRSEWLCPDCDPDPADPEPMPA